MNNQSVEIVEKIDWVAINALMGAYSIALCALVVLLGVVAIVAVLRGE